MCFEVRDKYIVTRPDIDLGDGNPMRYETFPLSIREMIYSLSNTDMYKYPYTEGDDNIRKVFLEYIEKEGFINVGPYKYDDVDDKGLSIHNLTFLPSTSITFNIIINIIAKPMATIPGMFRNTITLFRLSKSYELASLRAGFLIADEIIIREVINRIFQEMDSSPDIVGRALMGAFNATEEREKVYREYFTKLRGEYVFRYNILKSLVGGIVSIENYGERKKVIDAIVNYVPDIEIRNKIIKGLPYVKFPKNLEPEAVFFAILDFIELKGKSFNGKVIKTEKDVLEFFYYTNRIRFLIGQSISWPNKDELIGRITFAMDVEKLINTFVLMNKSLQMITSIY